MLRLQSSTYSNRHLPNSIQEYVKAAEDDSILHKDEDHNVYRCGAFNTFLYPGLRETLTDLRGGQTLFGQLEDLLFDIIRCELQPLKVQSEMITK